MKTPIELLLDVRTLFEHSHSDPADMAEPKMYELKRSHEQYLHAIDVAIDALGYMNRKLEARR